MRTENNPFAKKEKRNIIMVLSDGSRIKGVVDIIPKRWFSQADYEEELVREINKSQPRAVNKVVNVHLMRN